MYSSIVDYSPGVITAAIVLIYVFTHFWLFMYMLVTIKKWTANKCDKINNWILDIEVQEDTPTGYP